MKSNYSLFMQEDKHTTDATATELDLGHVGGVFVVLAAGVSLAVIISIFEFLWNVKKIAVAEKVSCTIPSSSRI